MPKKTYQRKRLDTAMKYLVAAIADLVAVLAHPDSTKSERQDARKALERLGANVQRFPAEGPEKVLGSASSVGTYDPFNDPDPDEPNPLDGW